MSQSRPAPAWDVQQWFNADASTDLASFRGKVVVAGAFQMLCPGCVAYLIPQLIQAHQMFPAKDVAVIGLHSVFEHHAAMGAGSLAAFLHEYRVTFPVAIDRPSGTSDPLPRTMRRYAMQGTPTLLLIDRQGNLRRQTFGHMPDLQLGFEIARLLEDRSPGAIEAAASATKHPEAGCAAGVCTPGAMA